MTEQDASKLSAVGRKHFHLIEFDESEEFVCEIRKHPVGLVLIYLSGALVTFLLLLIIMLLSGSEGFKSTLADMNAEWARSLLIMGGMLLVLLTIILTFIYGFLYRSNVIFITSEKIAQVLYRSIFNRKVSQLGIGDVQDVTVGQKGILARIFNYGTLVNETAGEQNNYIFTYIPHPYEASTEIVGTHERYMQTFAKK